MSLLITNEEEYQTFKKEFEELCKRNLAKLTSSEEKRMDELGEAIFAYEEYESPYEDDDFEGPYTEE